MTVSIQSELRLPCGAVLKNRLAKAAMTEGLADSMNRVTERHYRLYERWAKNGFGLMLTGNVHGDRRQLERPGNIVIDGNGGLDELRKLARIGTRDGAHFWMQINHPGRQTSAGINAKPLAPSAITLPMPLAAPGEAQEMTVAQIKDVTRRFVHVATTAREAGFTGVQIHAAHGYLFSNFLSPLANHRQDEYGGSLENRARVLMETLAATRKAVGADFPISVKLNSADFQRGGFGPEESMQVVRWLSDAGLDLLEISGGNYEQMQMVGMGDEAAATGRKVSASTAAREAYFLDYAKQVRPLVKMPLMITGGMRSLSVMDESLASGDCDVVGVGRPICTDPEDCGAKLLRGEATGLPAMERQLSLPRDAFGPDTDDATHKVLESFGQLGWYCLQLIRMGDGKEPNLDMSLAEALAGYEANETATLGAWNRP
ncbi:2,4-dienoyl-CoA reductase-like NADH-dependent reductase (Old Yellow Enzyme family) [Panacagrimonas perspica]|uniref:2,4-dienoyl-CoA reductase-like NADH-dependent reductase (Old Yellow Enzyme family) n=1 Tax=Panacagrimonas perspica TaxID=381431 RepID=A0A4R7PFS4_9GAMM|nr:NADH:flavin oxidoreductase/NADH oxidase family protein [Panacagrimonas perspica]TDU32230.1 2,4-dienoyl-CoA reductase-like NADH-dependent reductase (Old Yellow Enzyme family) [Panacagrimonas perspica]THD00579.1 NADH:flavin oxidoreductase [Panacagrimonas perspica]